MQTYTTRDHRILDLYELTEEQRTFFDRCYAASARDLPWLDLLRLIDGTENPLPQKLAPGDGDDVESDPLEDTWIPLVDAARAKEETVPGLHPDRAREAAARRRRPGSAAMARPVDIESRRRILEETNRDYATLRADPEAWQAELSERALWGATLQDGMIGSEIWTEDGDVIRTPAEPHG